MTFLDSIASIPDALSRMVDVREARMSGIANLVGQKEVKRVVFIGSGSSYNGALAACPFFDRLGIEAQVVFPNQFATYTSSFDHDALYVVISQGGATRLVFNAAKKLRAEGCRVCSVTADVTSPIARECDASIEMGCGRERYRYRTVGVDTTVVSCWQLAMTIALANGTMDKMMVRTFDDELRSVIKVMPKRLEDAITWYERNRFSLMRAHYLMFAGADDLWAVAREADIKVMEMVPLITRSFELEEIVHGPQNAFDASGAYLLFARDGVDADKAQSIAAFLRENIGFCALVGSAGCDANDFCFTEAAESFGSLEYLTFAQALAYRLADDRGRDLTKPINAEIARYVSKEL